MKVTLFLPLAFLAGAHGFAIFAPYLALFLAAATLLRRRSGESRPIPLPIPPRVGRVQI
jgi:hypothetical protein